MINQSKITVIEDFLHEMSAAYHLDNSTFSDLYSWHYFDKTAALKKEIIDNLNSLSPDRFNAYIKYVKEEIHEVYGHYNPDECIIGKWIEKFDLIEDDFPFYDNEEVTKLLNVNKKDYPLDTEKRRNIRLMQLEFHWYAGHLEYLKMKNFIDELLPDKTTNQEEKKAYKEDFWFKVGVKLASGQMAKYYTVDSKGIMHLKDNYTAPRVAEELGDKRWQKDVLATLKNYSPENANANKNIFNSRDKMMKIINHCKENGTPVISHFTDRLPSE